MKKYARIENGEVREIIDFDPQGRFTPELVSQFVECDNTVKQYDVYKDGVFAKKVIDLKKSKKENLEYQINDINKRMVEYLPDLIDVLIGHGVIPEASINPTAVNMIITRKDLKAQKDALEVDE